MTVKLLTDLILKSDTVDQIRSQIILLLESERENQKNLAIGAGENPSLWDFKVFEEKSSFLDELEDELPVINISYDYANISKRASTNAISQQMQGSFNIDVFAQSNSVDTASGHLSADTESVRIASRGLMLVRNILMSNINVKLQLPKGLVSKRWVDDITGFKPEFAEKTTSVVGAFRMVMQVKYMESAPQNSGVPLDEIVVESKNEKNTTINNASFIGLES